MTECINKFESLEEIVEFIYQCHPHINAPSGVFCIKLQKQSDGKRVLIESLKGVRIRELSIYNQNTIIIHQMFYEGSVGAGKLSHAFEALHYLPDLKMINVYDYSTEFLSNSCLDFIYLEQIKEAKMVFLSEFIHDIRRNLRAQWFKDKETEDLMNEVGIGPHLQQIVSLGRCLDIEC